MRRATTVDHARELAQQQVRVRQLEATLAVTEHRRDELERKYTKLKRRYAQLKQSFAELQQVSGIARDGNGGRLGSRQSSPVSSTASSSNSPTARSPQREEARDGVIDLTSPVASRRTSLASPVTTGTRRPLEASEDIIAESPSTPLDGVTARRAATASGSAVRRSARVAARASPNSLPPPAPPASTLPLRAAGRRRHLDFAIQDPISRPRPRLGPNASEESPQLTQANVRRHNLDEEDSEQALGGRVAARRSPVVHEESKSDSDSIPAIPAVLREATDSDEAASIALAQYLQHQENMAALQEYRDQLAAMSDEPPHRHHDREISHAVGTNRGRGQHLHDAAVDPDNMTHEELLRLGEEVGDVKKERWRQVAVQVLSSLPTHRWTTRSSDDISCIICQYGFSEGDVALTLPCAHVFHEECVSGWVRENNSCPLCKLEIADV